MEMEPLDSYTRAARWIGTDWQVVDADVQLYQEVWRDAPQEVGTWKRT